MSVGFVESGILPPNFLGIMLLFTIQAGFLIISLHIPFWVVDFIWTKFLWEQLCVEQIIRGGNTQWNMEENLKYDIMLIRLKEDVVVKG